MNTHQTSVVDALRHMHREFKNSPYFGTEDLKAIQSEIARHEYDNPEEHRLREMIYYRQMMIEQINDQYNLVELCPDLLHHFAQGMEDMQDALNKMVAERQQRQHSRIDYE